MRDNDLMSSLAVSRLALLEEMGVSNKVPKADSLPAENLPHASPVVDIALAKHPSFWIMLGKKLAARWWSNNPMNMALQIADPVLRPYAKRNPAMVVGVAAGAGAVFYVLRPWRLLSVTSVAMLFIRAPKIPTLALHLVQASKDGLHDVESTTAMKVNDPDCAARAPTRR
jgi:hypothetical protein